MEPNKIKNEIKEANWLTSFIENLHTLQDRCERLSKELDNRCKQLAEIQIKGKDYITAFISTLRRLNKLAVTIIILVMICFGIINILICLL